MVRANPLHQCRQIDRLCGIDMHGRCGHIEIVETIDESGVLVELRNICVVVMDLSPPWLLVEPGADALEGGAGINMTTNYHDMCTGLPIRD